MTETRVLWIQLPRHLSYACDCQVQENSVDETGFHTHLLHASSSMVQGEGEGGNIHLASALVSVPNRHEVDAGLRCSKPKLRMEVFSSKPENSAPPLPTETLSPSRHIYLLLLLRTTSKLLAATCGGGVEVNNNNNTVLKEAVPRHQQPAVGVAAVAATPCTSCFLQPPVPYHHRLQQPWAGMTAPTASQHQPTARRARVALEPEHAAASRRASQVPWARSGGAAKRSRLATAQSHDVSTAAGTSWANQQQFVVAAAPEAASRPSWSTPVACRQQQEPQMVAPCGGGVKDCKTCCQQPPVKETPEQQWGSQYYGPCRGASEDNTRILWNNESMLRLFQV
uniref:Uncharacterized protein n=1 Tax=Timema cristinae TaxID=61476 RepID=A0A7R9CBG8_TIMCR|nr:unnamed protein product [Timema cristinae]